MSRKEQAEEALAVVETELQGDASGAVYHQKDFADASITPSGERALRDGALAMAFAIIDMAEQNVGTSLGLPPPNNAAKGYAASHRKRESS